MDPENRALWLPKPRGHFAVGPAAYTHPRTGEVVVRVRAIAVNPVDNLPGLAYRLVLPWLTFPAVVGGDVAGEIVEIGADVTRLHVGDRVLGMAAASEEDRNRAAEGAFQLYVVLMQNLVAPIPDELPFEDAAVLPLALSTAASGMFQQDQLGLPLPSVTSVDRGESVLVWGGSTSVGSNAIQLARCAGFRVIATASPRNFDYVKSLGAEAVVDYRNKDAVGAILDALSDSPLAGTIAIGSGSLSPTVAVASAAPGSKRIATANRGPVERMRVSRLRRKGIRLSLIWGGTLKDNEVGAAIYNEFLPDALRTGAYRAAPAATVVGSGLEAIPDALHRLRGGVSAAKLVVSV